MSAWVVEREHIDVMLRAALYGPADNEGDVLYMNGTRWDEFYWYHGDERHTLTLANASEVGRMLAEENVASVCCRYDDDTADVYEDVLSYHYRNPGFAPTVAEIVKTISCYEYQSCEHEGWKDSSAAAFCEALKAAAIWKMPGLSAAPWGWDTEKTEARRGVIAV